MAGKAPEQVSETQEHAPFGGGVFYLTMNKPQRNSPPGGLRPREGADQPRSHRDVG